jgi:hypothetical protein
MADATSFEWQIQDDQGLTNRTQMYMAYDGATETTDALIGEWQALGGLLDAVVDGKIIGGQILIPLVGAAQNPTWKQTPTVGNNVNQVMDLAFHNDFNSYLTNILIPSYKESQLSADKKPNLAATALAALIAAIIDDGGTAFVNSRDLHQLDAVVKGFLTVRKLRNARLRMTTTK